MSPEDGIPWATSTEVVTVDPTTGRVDGVLTKLPPGLDVGEPAFDRTGAWMTFGAAAANAKSPYEGVFIFHDGQFWQVPRSASLDGLLRRIREPRFFYGPCLGRPEPERARRVSVIWPRSVMARWLAPSPLRSLHVRIVGPWWRSW
jgi:hypothetical protein